MANANAINVGRFQAIADSAFELFVEQIRVVLRISGKFTIYNQTGCSPSKTAQREA